MTDEIIEVTIRIPVRGYLAEIGDPKTHVEESIRKCLGENDVEIENYVAGKFRRGIQ